ncbi:MAG: C13 family peptidase [Vicinamibacterales bacterium]|nr:C13 family peptidase [Vicinamibacterales bacterium]
MRAQDGASHVLVIVGLGGDHENAERFHGWAATIVDAARERFAVPRENIVYLGEDTARDPGRISGRSTREAIGAAVTALAANARPGDRVFVVLIGHGASAVPGAPRFNLPGPDLTATDFARLMDRLAAQTVTFVNTASASGGFVAALSGPGRTVVTATRSDGERNQTRFGEFFAEALVSPDADGDKDGRISMLEAFTFARAQVVASYERDGQLLTEHAVLDDNGDRQGTEVPGQPGQDGALARSLFLSPGARGDTADATADPELQTLVARRQAIEGELAALKAGKNTRKDADYERELERVLTELARVSRAIREKQKR